MIIKYKILFLHKKFFTISVEIDKSGSIIPSSPGTQDLGTSKEFGEFLEASVKTTMIKQINPSSKERYKHTTSGKRQHDITEYH